MHADRLVPVARSATILAGAFVLSGCFRYVRGDLATAPVGEHVRVYLQPQGTAMADMRQLAPAAEPVVSGQIVERDRTRVLLRIADAVGNGQGYTIPLGQDLGIPTAEILQLERRRIDPVKTGIFTALGAAAAASVVVAIMSGAFTSGRDGGDVEQQLRIPLGF